MAALHELFFNLFSKPRHQQNVTSRAAARRRFIKGALHAFFIFQLVDSPKPNKKWNRQ
jgi:hypothetical protein